MKSFIAVLYGVERNSYNLVSLQMLFAEMSMYFTGTAGGDSSPV